MIKALISTLYVLIIVSQAFSQDVYLKLTTGQRKKIKIVLSFQAEKGAETVLQEMAQQIKKIVKDDLNFSLYFGDIVDTTVGDEKIDFPFWVALGVSAFIKGEILFKKQDTLANVEIYDVYTRHRIASDKYKIQRPTFRSICHRISDDIIKSLTGEEGVSQTRIVFSFKTGSDKELAIIDYDGHNFKQLTRGKGLHYSPKWVPPQSEAITYATYRGEDIWIYKFELYTGKLFTLSQEKGVNIGANWSPNGKELALTMTKEGNPEIYIKTGDKFRRLTVNSAIDASPTWSPNGREIAFVSDRSGSPQIYIMDKDGTNVRRLTFSGNYNTSPAWSPKGDRIAYVSREVDGTFQIHSILVNGEGDTYLTWEGNNEDPSWSPDGLHLCFISSRNGRDELFTMHWDGSGQKRVAFFGSGCSTPSWSTK